MHQILQNLNTGESELSVAPVPQCASTHLLICSSVTLISAGTERSLVDFSRASVIGKVRAQPDKARQIVEKIEVDGLVTTATAVLSRLNQPISLGYCNAGRVLEVGQGTRNFTVGERVVSNGPHAEIASIPHTLCVKIPGSISDETAAFAVLGAIGLQGVRLVAPAIGETVVVSGLGLVGLLTLQILLANGCQVIGIDFAGPRLDLARRWGAQVVALDQCDPVAAALAVTGGRGVDAVLITASTKSSEPVHQAAQMCRKRGRIVLVGVTGLELSRADFYEKELSFQVSCSYGPGRYDETYEQKGQDYPLGFVRWTAQRNFEAVLDLMAAGKLDVEPLISARYPITEAPAAYERLTTDKSVLGILLTYPPPPQTLERTIEIGPNAKHQTRVASQSQASPTVPSVGMVGAGNFASLVLLPALVKSGASLHTIASSGGTSAAIAARKFGFRRASSDVQAVLADPQINTVFIATRHQSHASLVVDALRGGKHVFVEKPLALTRAQLDDVAAAVRQQPQAQLLVGFNRRFSPLAQRMHQLLVGRNEPLTLVYMVNAGAIPSGHWTQDTSEGGGRIIGEGCHFIDLLRFLVGQPIVDVTARMVGSVPSMPIRSDKMSITLEFADGSLGTIHYFANGSKRYPKERVEVYSQGRVLVLDNFRALHAYGWANFRGMKQWQQDKGHKTEIAAFLQRVQEGGQWLIPWQEIEEVTLASFVAMERAAEPRRGLA